VRTERTWAIIATAAGVAAFAAEWRGLSPVFVTVVALATWLSVAVRRLGIALGAASVVVGWMSLLLMTLTLTPGLGIDPPIAVGVSLVCAIAASIPTVMAIPPQANRAGEVSAILASLAGTVSWVLGLTWGFLAPHGGGLSWAAYKDSSNAIWLLRGLIQYRGVPSVSNPGMPVRLGDALTASMVPPGTIADASPMSIAAQLSAHAMEWSVLICLASLLSGLVVVAVATRAGGRRWPTLVAAAAASMVLLVAPVTGRILDLGQIDSHLVLVLLGATVLAGIGAERHLLLSLSVLLAAMGLLVITWTPFAAVPGVIALVIAGRAYRAHLGRQRVLAYLLPGAAVAAWIFAIYGPDLLRSTLGGSAATDYATVATFSRPGYVESFTNPYWWPLSIGIPTVTVVVSLLLARKAPATALIAWLSTAGFVLGMLPFALIKGGLTIDLAYYPAKYLSLTTISLVPLMLGMAVRVIADGPSRSRRAIAALSVVAVFGLAVVAPTPPETSRWAITPLLIARGEHYGTNDQVAGQIVGLTSNDALVLPWAYDPPFDTQVLLMNSGIGPNVDNILLDPARYVLRYYRGDFATQVACDLADASLRPVILITRDAGLQDAVARECPSAHITVRYEAVKSN
jgi:hypothetical protein